MKNSLFLLLLTGLFCNASLLAQSLNEPQDGSNKQSQEIFSAKDIKNEADNKAFDQSSSPLMMFGGDVEESLTKTTSDPRTEINRSDAGNGATSANNSQAGRDTTLAVTEIATPLSKGTTSFRSASSERAAEDGVVHDSTKPDDLALDEDYLISTWREAEETTDRLIQKREWIQKRMAEGSLLPSQLRSRTELLAQSNRDEWQEISHRHSTFIEEASEGEISDTTRQQIVSLITASNEAFEAAQEILDLFTPSETSRIVSSSHASGAAVLSILRAPKMYNSSSSARVASPPTSLQASLHDHMQDRCAVAMEAFHERKSFPRDEKGNVKDEEGKNRFQVMRALKAYEEKLEVWVSDAKRQALGEASAIKRAATKITSHFIDSLTASLDFSTPRDRAVFWTGYVSRNQGTAIMYASDQGKHTLEMTPGGSFLDGLGLYAPDSIISSNLPNALFDTASKKFAENAKGDVTAVIVKVRYPNSVYSRIERPILKRHEKQGLVKLEELKIPTRIAGLFWKQLDAQKEVEATQVKELQQKAKEAHAKARAAYAANKNEEGESWENVENSFSLVVGKLQKALEAKEAGKTEEAKSWHDAATFQQQSIEPHTQAARAYATGKTTEGKYWRDAGRGLDLAAEKLVGAIKAEATDKRAAQQWRDAAARQQQSSESYTQAAIAYAAKEESNNWSETAEFASKSADQLKEAAGAVEKATQAAAQGNEPLREYWNQVAVHYKTAGEYYRKAAEVPAQNYLRAAKFLRIFEDENEEEDEGDSTSEHRLKLKRAKAKYEEYAEAGDSLSQAADSASESADELKKAAEALEKATEAAVQGNKTLSEYWSQIAEQYQVAVEYYQKLEKARAQGSEKEADLIDKVGTCASKSAYQLQKAAEALEKATQATKQGNQALSEHWNQVVVQYQEAAEYTRKSAAAYAQGNEEEAERFGGYYIFGNAAPTAMESGDQLKEAAEALEKATQAIKQGNQALSERWNKVAGEYQVAAEYARKSAAAYAQGNVKEAKRLSSVASCSVSVLKEAIEASEKAMQAAAQGNESLSQYWNQVTARYQTAAEYYRKAAQAATEGNEPVSERWNQVAEQNQTAAKYFRKVAETWAEGDEEEVVRLLKGCDSYAGNIADELKEALEALEKATEAATEGNQPLSELWNQVAAQNQVAAEHYQKAAEAKAQWNEEEAERFGGDDGAGYSASRSADQLKEALEALEKATGAATEGNQPLSELWNQVAEQYKVAAKHYKKSA